MRLGVWGLLSVSFFANVTLAGPAASLDMRKLERQFYQDNQFVQNTWEGTETAPAPFCDDHTWYRALVQAEINDVKFEIMDRGSILLTGSFLNPYAKIDARHSSPVTFCSEVAGWLGVGAGRLDIQAEIDFHESEDGKMSVSVRMVYTRFDRMNVGPIPKWMEEPLARIVNRAFRAVWESRISGWANQRIADEINAVIAEHTDGN